MNINRCRERNIVPDTGQTVLMMNAWIELKRNLAANNIAVRTNKQHEVLHYTTFMLLRVGTINQFTTNLYQTINPTTTLAVG